jgi:large subunit ribosomal protein L4
MAFPPGTRSFDVKVNRKARRAALKGALTDHARNGTFALLDGSAFESPSTRKAAELLSDWSDRPTLVVTTEDEDVLVKSFRNLDKVLVTVPAELEVVSVVWARSVLVSEAALPLVLARAGAATTVGEEDSE